MKFADLRLAEPILRAVASEGYDVPTPIQAQAIPHILDGKDLLGCAQTGTGKTAAFALPILDRLLDRGSRTVHRRPIRCLVLSPTRELAAQIGESFTTYGKNTTLRSTVVYGGVGQGSQTQALQRGVDILVATPGRLLDLMQQGYINLSSIECFVLDEADRMLDMGFIHDIRKVIAKLPDNRQTLMFSATMPGEIRKLSGAILTNPVSIEVARVSAPAELVEQSVYHTSPTGKPKLLAHLLSTISMTRAIVFTRTKYGADKVARFLVKSGVRAESIHGDKSQSQRLRALANFKANKTPVLVATDIAARGLDIDEISHVVNFDLPYEAETYVHRIGRTGRAGATGEAISFCTPEARSLLKAVERLTRRTIRVVEGHPFPESGDARDLNGAPTKGNAKPQPAPTNGTPVSSKRVARDAFFAGSKGKAHGSNHSHGSKPSGKPGRGGKFKSRRWSRNSASRAS